MAEIIFFMTNAIIPGVDKPQKIYCLAIDSQQLKTLDRTVTDVSQF